MHINKTSWLFKNIHVTITEPKNDGYKKERKHMFTDIGGKWYISNLNAKPPPSKNPI